MLLSPVTDLHDVFDQRLVRADLCTLQPADAFPDPGDEGELGSFAHGISRRDPEEAKQTSVVCGKTGMHESRQIKAEHID